MPEGHLDVEALYAALDARRKSKDLSWREVAREAGVSPSTLTRMAQGKRPDVDGFAALLGWLGIRAEKFLKTGQTRVPKAKEDPMAMISTYLRASKELDKKTVEALENIIQVAWRNLKQS